MINIHCWLALIVLKAQSLKDVKTIYGKNTYDLNGSAVGVEWC